MKTTELNKIMKDLEFPLNYIKKGRLAYYFIEHNNGKILVGFYLDQTGYKESFFLQFFVQCLYVPFITYNFSLGDRIGHHWEKEDIDKINNLIEKESRKLITLSTFDNFIDYLNSHSYFGHESGKKQYYAYTFFFLDRYADCINYLDKIINLKNHNFKPEWFIKNIKDAESLTHFIINKEYKQAKDILIKWQAETISNLKIE